MKLKWKVHTLRTPRHILLLHEKTTLHLTPLLHGKYILSSRANKMPDRTNIHKKTNTPSLPPPLHLLHFRRFTMSPLPARCGQNYNSGTTADINNHSFHDNTPPLVRTWPLYNQKSSATGPQPLPIAPTITIRGKTNHLESERDNACRIHRTTLHLRLEDETNDFNS